MQKIAKIVGTIFVLIGILGFIPSVTSGGYLFGIFMVSTTHNIIHLLTGIIACMSAKSASGAKKYFVIFGIIYLLVAILGFMGESVLGLITVNSADNILYIVIAIIFLALGFRGSKSGSNTPQSTPNNPIQTPQT